MAGCSASRTATGMGPVPPFARQLGKSGVWQRSVGWGCVGSAAWLGSRPTSGTCGTQLGWLGPPAGTQPGWALLWDAVGRPVVRLGAGWADLSGRGLRDGGQLGLGWA